MIYERYRQDYDGEFILVEINLQNNQTRQKREWIDNPIQNSHISGRAAVIGEQFSYGKFSHRRLQSHRGGLLATKSLQTYGIGNLWQDMRFDFFLADRPTAAEEIIKKKYYENSVVYSTPRLCIQYPGCFYTVPYQPPIDVLAQILYLAAFDGHQEIFMLGYRGDLRAGTTNWIEDVNQVIKTYAGTKFYVVNTANVPGIWLNNHNVDVMDYRRFISYCDI
jgi:hypothetical protein